MKTTEDIVLITGSNGRIGTAILRRLSARFNNIVGFDLKAPSPPPPGCTRIPVDIASDESVPGVIEAQFEYQNART